MRPFGRWSYTPARREPGSRQPDQYALATTTTYRMWKRLAERPGGTRLFSAAAMVRVPYFASIVPHVVRMEPGFAEVTVPKWFFVKGVDIS